MTSVLDDVLAEAARGDRPDGIVLMRLLGEAATEEEARAALARAGAACAAAGDADGRTRIARLERLWATQPQAWSVVRSVLGVASHEPAAGPPVEALRHWAGVFDRLAAASPEAGVALYSFGSADLLEAATQEIVAYLDGLGLLGPERDVLDFGCGIGRIAAALSRRVGSVVGIDLSAGMIEAARRRCQGLANLRFRQGDGGEIDLLAAESLDLVVAADVFPYLVQAGGALADALVRAVARVLRPGGALVILNYSYRGDRDADRRDVGEVAAATGLRILRNGCDDLRTWDAGTFLLAKPARSSAGGRAAG